MLIIKIIFLIGLCVLTVFNLSYIYRAWCHAHRDNVKAMTRARQLGYIHHRISEKPETINNLKGDGWKNMHEVLDAHWPRAPKNDHVLSGMFKELFDRFLAFRLFDESEKQTFPEHTPGKVCQSNLIPSHIEPDEVEYIGPKLLFRSIWPDH